MARAKSDFIWAEHPPKYIRHVMLHITNWSYNVISTETLTPEIVFQIGGVVLGSRCKGLEGLKGRGSIKVSDHLINPEADKLPHRYRGSFGMYDTKNDPQYFENPHVGLTLLASKDMRSELFRMFSFAFSATKSQQTGLFLNLALMHPNGANPEFWQADWHKSDLYIDE